MKDRNGEVLKTGDFVCGKAGIVRAEVTVLEGKITIHLNNPEMIKHDPTFNQEVFLKTSWQKTSEALPLYLDGFKSLMHAETVLVTYQIEMTVDDYLKLDSHGFLDVVNPALTKLGAKSVDYDGCFGPMIQFEAEPDVDTRPIVEAVQKLINTPKSGD